jgi:hypothetical protein
VGGVPIEFCGCSFGREARVNIVGCTIVQHTREGSWGPNLLTKPLGLGFDEQYAGGCKHAKMSTTYAVMSKGRIINSRTVDY